MTCYKKVLITKGFHKGELGNLSQFDSNSNSYTIKLDNGINITVLNGEFKYVTHCDGDGSKPPHIPIGN